MQRTATIPFATVHSARARLRGRSPSLLSTPPRVMLLRAIHHTFLGPTYPEMAGAESGEREREESNGRKERTELIMGEHTWVGVDLSLGD